MKHFYSLQKAAFAAISAASLVLVPITSSAQQTVAPSPAVAAETAPEEAFSYELGRASVSGKATGTSQYSVAATRDFASKEKSGKIRLMVMEQDGMGTMTHLMTVNTGKFKTVAQLSAQLADIFRQYLAAEPANQEIGKIGDVSHGGEIRFFAESREQFRYEWLVPGQEARSVRFKRGDIQAFLGILTHPHAAAN